MRADNFEEKEKKLHGKIKIQFAAETHFIIKCRDLHGQIVLFYKWSECSYETAVAIPYLHSIA